MEDKGEIYCRFIKTTRLKGKSEDFKVYKAFWSPTEIERDKAPEAAPKKEEKKRLSPIAKILLYIVAPFLIIFMLIKGIGMVISSSDQETRTKHHTIEGR
jgi:hypothetical protein